MYSNLIEERDLGERASLGRTNEFIGEIPMSFVGKQVERVTVHDSVYVIYLPLCQWFLSLLAEKLPQKGNLWQPDSPKFFDLSQIKEAPKRPIFGSVISQMSSV